MRQQCEASDMCGLHQAQLLTSGKTCCYLVSAVPFVHIKNVNTSEDSDLWPGSDAAVRAQNQTPEESAIPYTRGKPAAGISEHDKNQSHDPWAESGGEETQRLSVNWSFKWWFLVTRRMKQFLFFVWMCCHMWRHSWQRIQRIINVQCIALFL